MDVPLNAKKLSTLEYTKSKKGQKESDYKSPMKF